MNPLPITRREMVAVCFISFFIILFIVLSTVFDQRTKIVFCDVSQGDATYIRVKNKYDVLIDAGPQRQILSCLGKHMPFYDRTIELAIISHPEIDHYGGYIFLLDRYRIKNIYRQKSNAGSSKTFHKILTKIEKQEINTIDVRQRHLSIGNDQLKLLWPAEKSANRLGNESSLVFTFQEEKFKVLFTGDAVNDVWNGFSSSSLPKVNILKVPHHGSKNGLSQKLLRLAEPQLAVISVGKNNAYGHPAKETLDLLKAANIKVYRTDLEGDIVIKIPN